MQTGTICDFDSQGEFGLIEADDGRIVCFNRGNVIKSMAPILHVGTRVAFVSDRHPAEAHVEEVRLWSAEYSGN